MILWILAGLVTLAPPGTGPRLAGFRIHGSPVLALQDSLDTWQTAVRDSAPSARVLGRLVHRITRFFQNRGFPFSRVRVAYFTGPEDSLTAHLVVQPGPLVKPGVLRAEGVPGVPGPLRRWFAPALRNPYAVERLRTLAEGWNLRFGDRLTVDSFRLRPPDTLLLFVQQHPANHLEGALSYDQAGRLLGRLSLRFLNLGGTLRALAISWYRWRAEEQELQVAYEEPWVPYLQIRLEGRGYLQDTLMQVWEGAVVVFPLQLSSRLGLGIAHQRSLWIPTQERHRETRSLIYAEGGTDLAWLLRAEATSRFLRYQARLRLRVQAPPALGAGAEVVSAGLYRSPALQPTDLLEVPLSWLPFGLRALPREFRRLLGIRYFVGLTTPALALRGMVEQNFWRRRLDDPQGHRGWGAGLELTWRTPGGLRMGLQYTWRPGLSPWDGVLRIDLSQGF